MGKLYNSAFAQKYLEDVSFFRQCTFNLGGGGKKITISRNVKKD